MTFVNLLVDKERYQVEPGDDTDWFVFLVNHCHPTEPHSSKEVVRMIQWPIRACTDSRGIHDIRDCINLIVNTRAHQCVHIEASHKVARAVHDRIPMVIMLCEHWLALRPRRIQIKTSGLPVIDTHPPYL